MKRITLPAILGLLLQPVLVPLVASSAKTGRILICLKLHPLQLLVWFATWKVILRVPSEIWKVLNLKKYKVASNLIFFMFETWLFQVCKYQSLVNLKKSGVDKTWHFPWVGSKTSFFKSNISVQIKLASISFSCSLFGKSQFCIWWLKKLQEEPNMTLLVVQTVCTTTECTIYCSKESQFVVGPAL